MESAQVAATKGKERRDATKPKHPFKFPQYKSKTVKYVKKCPVIPGSPVEDSMLQDCAEYITKLRELECVSPMNVTYDRKSGVTAATRLRTKTLPLELRQWLDFSPYQSTGKT